MPPRKAAVAKAAPAAKKAAPVKEKAAKADKVDKTEKAAAPKPTKRKRADDDDEPKTNGVNGVHDKAEKPAKKAKTDKVEKKVAEKKVEKKVEKKAEKKTEKKTEKAEKAEKPKKADKVEKKVTEKKTEKKIEKKDKVEKPKKAETKRAKTPAAETDKENTAPTTDNKKRAKSATPAPAPKAAKATATKRKTKAEKAAEAAEAEKKEDDNEDVEMADDDEVKAAPAKKVKKVKAEPAPKSLGKIGSKINDAPTDILDIFVFGEGGAGELGLGSVRDGGKKPLDVKRPRLNGKLPASTVGVVQVAAGGMHAVALTKDNKILTWGVNDQGALGRDTAWDGGLREADQEDDSDSDDDDDTGLNPHESTPSEIDTTLVVPGTKFVQVVASDSASFALTEDGRVYGWGTFRASDGILGFSRDVKVQKIPTLLPEPKKVKQLATGSNHILALDAKGKLFTWGCPEQNQLGRRCVQRDIKESALRPGGVGFKRGVHVAKIACGSYHSFALDKSGDVYAWGLNNFGQLSVDSEGAGDSDATVLDATLVEGFPEGAKVASIDGGEHHSVACTEDGKLFTWGRIDGHQVGLPSSVITEENAIFDEYGKPRILKAPTAVPDVPATITEVSAGTDNSFALTRDGKVYSWGFSANYQTGQGTIEDIETPTLIDNTAVREKKLVFAGAGGQFSILASVAE
ncbi:rcc1 domain-containing protein [Ophiostoma piceae UAMH 11346]|uniref:Rcc1 domain-containing protein n=1 Tax=Ophiostoma piceae (strain UAMH 11346) TaxID=1262450 RepID=S3C126_OPHP1|nr:rcc1 domain-containing protein [Ophiostoma piceae UAMH 11346]